MINTKMFCIPYAGGSANTYYQWKRYITDHIELVPVELAGRGSRIRDPFYPDVDAAVEDIYQTVFRQLNDNEPYYLFGHSMGSILVYELCRKIQATGKRQPEHIFFSGRDAPSNHKVTEIVHHLPDQEFIKKVKLYGGMDERILENSALLDLFLPIMKADFKIIENYGYLSIKELIKSDISILIGKEDAFLTEEKVKMWAEETSKNCEIYAFEGGHFFLFEHPEKVAACINDIIHSNVRE
ncbi:thioesterase [Viridibacillus sp. YIM B01967]|uniref:Thioesterase n=1 Tax=Viridibacillus soli TaxID=2798301 RepID=A0ABS1HCP5_9BACL|nr:alpha/beta fold hydrolase [Viridibacillus soli]MBK3497212.1 thioesterase [Viridibacillus soli]